MAGQQSQYPQHQPPQQPQYPQPQQYAYMPPQPPPKRRTGPLAWAGLVVVLGLVGLIVYAVIAAKQRDAERQAAEQQARAEATTEARTHIERAKTLYAESKLEEAVKEAEQASSYVLAAPAEVAEARKLLDEYGAEYGKRFEGQVAELIEKARAALKTTDADGAEKSLNEAVAFRYAPNTRDAAKLRAELREARSEIKMRSYVEAMTDNEFEAFRADLTLPNRAVFADTDLQAVFVASLKLSHDNAVKWREEMHERALREAEKARLAREAERVKRKEQVTKAAFRASIIHSTYLKMGFVLAKDNVRATRHDGQGNFVPIAFYDKPVYYSVYERRTQAVAGVNAKVVQTDALLYWNEPGKASGMQSGYSQVFAFHQVILGVNATDEFKGNAVGESPAWYLLGLNPLWDSEGVKKAKAAEESARLAYNAQVRRKEPNPLGTESFEIDGFQVKLTVKEFVFHGQNVREVFPVDFPEGWWR